MRASASTPPQWLGTGHEAFPAMLAAIANAKESVRLETYIFTDGNIGRQFLAALTSAAQRGVRVFVLIDALGSWPLADVFFDPLIAASGNFRRFNPLRLWRVGVRDHRKLLVCDGHIAFIGGFNLADEYAGDGVNSGWCDLGLRIENQELAAELAGSFDELFALADFRRKPLLRLRAFKRKRKASVLPASTSLWNQPGPSASPLHTALHHDLVRAREVRIISAYFLPTRKLRRDLLRVARRGGRVQLILAGKSDVPLAQQAGRNLYRRLLAAGIEIYEYQPQILHAKLVIVDGAAYVGSANFDVRSLKLNYELMVRVEDKTHAGEARKIFESIRQHCQRIDPQRWHSSQSFWQRWKNRWSNFLLARIDPIIALRQFRALKK